MNQISYAFLTFLFVTCLTINIRSVLCSNETEDTTVSTTAITLTENEVTPGCRCRDNRHLNLDEPGNCSTKSWAFKYGKLWCYVELPSNCNDLKNSTLEPNEKYSAQACSGKVSKGGNKKPSSEKWFKFLVDGVLKMCMGLLGIFMNSIAIWILVTERKMQSMFLHILTFSFVCDIGYLFAEFLATLHHEFNVYDLVWLLPHFAYPFKEIFYAANILTTIGLSYERFSLILDKSGYRAKMEVASFRYHRLRKYVIIIAFISILINIPSFLTYTMSKVTIDDDHTFEWRRLRTDLRNDSTYTLLDKGIKWSIILVTSFALLVFFNRRVYVDVKDKMNMRAKRNSGRGAQLDMSNASKIRKRLNFIKAMRKTEKFTLALFAVVGAFLICNVWYLVEVILKSVDPKIMRSVPHYATLSRLMRTLNSCTNVLVYCFADRTFKRYLKRYIYRILFVLSCSLIKPPPSVEGDGSTSQLGSTKVHSRGPQSPSINQRSSKSRSASISKISSKRRSSSKSVTSDKRSSAKSSRSHSIY